MALVTKRKSVSESEEAAPVGLAPAHDAPANDGTGVATAVRSAATPLVFDPAASTTSTTSTGGDDVAELRSSLHDLQATVAALMAKTEHPGDVARDPMARDSDVASRIIVAANHAADATIESARSEAEDLLTTAKAKSFEIIGVARELADQELAAERERVARATADWMTTRSEITDRLLALESSMGGYQADLAAAAATVRAAIEQLRLSDDEMPEAVAAVAHGDVAGETADPPAEQPNAGTDHEGAAALPGLDEGGRRSNLFGGDAASRRLAESMVPPAPVTAPVTAPVNGTNGTNGTYGDNGTVEPGKLRAGFFGR